MTCCFGKALSATVPSSGDSPPTKHAQSAPGSHKTLARCTYLTSMTHSSSGLPFLPTTTHAGGVPCHEEHASRRPAGSNQAASSSSLLTRHSSPPAVQPGIRAGTNVNPRAESAHSAPAAMFE